MSFLAPLFLLGALAIAGPVIFHLIRRTTRERTRFSSLLFLRPVPPRLTRRSRIEHWLLLLLRAVALGLLALAFARPLIRSELLKAEEDPSAGRRVVVLVDVSASMQRAGLRDAALEKAEAVLRKARPMDEVAVVAFAVGTQTLMDFEQWSALPEPDRATTAGARLRDVAAGWAATNLSAALMGAAEMLTAAPGGAKSQASGEIVLISDLQEGSRMQGLQGWDWPREVRLTVTAVTPKKPGNAGLHLAADISGATAPEEPVGRVRVWNAQDSTSEQFQVGWASADGKGFSGTAQDVYVPPGQARVVTLPQGPEAAGRMLLRGDAEPFDNGVFMVASVTARVKAYYLGAEAATDSRQPLFFLNRALPNTRQVAVDIEPLAPSAPLPAAVPGESVIFFATGALPMAQADALHARLVAGRTVVLALTHTEAAPALARLAGVSSISLEETKPASSYAMLAEIDFQHPLFSPFADPRFSDFTKIRFWKYRRFDAGALPGSRVLARFDSGDPALVEVPVGTGRLMVLAAGWHPEDSQLALSSKFVPLLSSLLEWSGTVVTPPAQHFAGQPVSLAQLGLSDAGPVTVRHPDGTVTAVEAASGEFSGALQPGVYTAVAGSLSRPFAVNPDPAESRTVPLSPDELERLGAPVAAGVSTPEKASPASELAPAVETESRQKLWRWVIAAVLAVLVVETLLAGLTARRALTAGGPTP